MAKARAASCAATRATSCAAQMRSVEQELLLGVLPFLVLVGPAADARFHQLVLHHEQAKAQIVDQHVQTLVVLVEKLAHPSTRQIENH